MRVEKIMMPGANALSRRDFSRLLSTVGLACVAMPYIGGRALAASEATYFTWASYDDPKIHAAYIAKHGASPSFSLFGDEAEALQKVRAGFAPDVAHPCSYNTELWRDAGVIQSIDTSRLSNWEDVFPQLRNLPGTQRDGEQWFVPFDWGNTSILYRTDLVDVKEESWNLLWDERYKGRLASMDILEDIVPVGAIHAGLDPFTLDAAGIAKVKAALVKQRPLLRFYSNDMSSIEQALASGELVAAMTWNASAVTLKGQGLPVKFMNPKEGMLTWVCGLVMLKDAPNLEKAYDLINSMIDPVAGQFLIEKHGYGHCNKKAFGLVNEDRLTELNLTRDPTDLLKAGVFLAPLSNRNELIKMVEEVKAGF